MEQSRPELSTPDAIREALVGIGSCSGLEIPSGFIESFLDGNVRAEDSSLAGTVMSKLMLQYRLPPHVFVKYRAALKESFSNLTWENVRQVWPQCDSLRAVPSKDMDVPYVSRSFIDRVFERMRDAEWTNIDLAQLTQPSFVRSSMEVAQYFLGAVRNEAERGMRGESTHGQVELVWVAFRLSVVVVVMEMKRKGFALDNYAQLMGELKGIRLFTCLMQKNPGVMGLALTLTKAAAFTNAESRCPVDVIRGLMANKDGWIFMDHDVKANTFAISSTLVIDDHKTTVTIQNRIVGMRLMWLMFLDGYCSAVRAMQVRSQATVERIETELCPPADRKRKSEATNEILQKRLADRQSILSRWTNVANLAFQARSQALAAEFDTAFEETMKLLHTSIDAVPEYYSKPFDVYAAWKELEGSSEHMLKKWKF
ncbi:hypothetical protein HKX48_009438 [Thoreauomyces humboldtii]|nr:hypothetical protein HKX48_009438 [Thoreauomyces humboldtii]